MDRDRKSSKQTAQHHETVEAPIFRTLPTLMSMIAVSGMCLYLRPRVRIWRCTLAIRFSLALSLSLRPSFHNFSLYSRLSSCSVCVPAGRHNHSSFPAFLRSILSKLKVPQKSFGFNGMTDYLCAINWLRCLLGDCKRWKMISCSGLLCIQTSGGVLILCYSRSKEL